MEPKELFNCKTNPHFSIWELNCQVQKDNKNIKKNNKKDCFEC